MFIIVMLCNDNGEFYIDYVNKKFDNFQEAQDEMYKCEKGSSPSCVEDPLLNVA